ncbi:MAG: hypothetical protein V3W14_11695, partial [Candidatus Neomarinimicrobiota bacterium]
MKRLIVGFPYIFLGISILAACGLENPASDDDGGDQVTVLTNGTLIDGTGAEPVPDVRILIRNEYIEAVGTASTVIIPAGAEVIDVMGAYILPGLMNTHVHSGYTKSNLAAWAQAGVTTVRDVGDFSMSPRQAYSTRDSRLQNNEYARLVAAGPLVTTVGGYGNYPVTSADNAERVVTDLIGDGADFIKIAIEDNLQGRTWSMLSQAEITRIVETAHGLGKPVAAHISRT